MKADKTFFKQILEEMIPYHRFLGVVCEDISEGFACLRVPFREEFIGDPRVRALHGGLIATVMDSAGGAAAMTTLVSPDDRLSTIDMRVDYLLPGKPLDFYVEGSISRSGNRIIVTRMIAWQGNRENLIAEGRGVYNVKRNRRE